MRAKLTNTQLNNLKPAAKKKTGIILRLNKKTFADEKLPHCFISNNKTNN